MKKKRKRVKKAMESIIELITERLPRMSKGHKAIANYIIESYDKS